MSKYAPYDIHTNTDSLKTFLAGVPSVVLNTTTKSLVLLPFSNKDLLEQAQMVFDNDLGIMLIDDEHYSALQQIWVLPKASHSDIAINYFMQRCIELCSGDIPTPILHQESYRYIYESLIYECLDIIDVIKRVPQIVDQYGEDSVADIVFGQSALHEKKATNNDISRAIDMIENTEVSGKQFELCYRTNEGSAAEDVVILYKKSK